MDCEPGSRFVCRMVSIRMDSEATSRLFSGQTLLRLPLTLRLINAITTPQQRGSKRQSWIQEWRHIVFSDVFILRAAICRCIPDRKQQEVHSLLHSISSNRPFTQYNEIDHHLAQDTNTSCSHHW
ncbi:hypothetical protein TNCV_4099001 [Trichonephila clavipes]|nr:hypothetical protein TNCV_4099001 [Trichonephila clavipes]